MYHVINSDDEELPEEEEDMYAPQREGDQQDLEDEDKEGSLTLKTWLQCLEDRFTHEVGSSFSVSNNDGDDEGNEDIDNDDDNDEMAKPWKVWLFPSPDFFVSHVDLLEDWQTWLRALCWGKIFLTHIQHPNQYHYSSPLGRPLLLLQLMMTGRYVVLQMLSLSMCKLMMQPFDSANSDDEEGEDQDEGKDMDPNARWENARYIPKVPGAWLISIHMQPPALR